MDKLKETLENHEKRIAKFDAELKKGKKLQSQEEITNEHERRIAKIEAELKKDKNGSDPDQIAKDHERRLAQYEQRRREEEERRIAEENRIKYLANRVMNGDFGNGEERRQKLGADYTRVQNRVNEILGFNKRY